MTDGYKRRVLIVLSVLLSSSGCFHSSNGDSDEEEPLPIGEYRLNDTGVDTWLAVTTNPDTSVTYSYATTTQSDLPGQDADQGRDVNAAAATDGKLGFNFVKLDSDGQALTDQTAEYFVTPWSCIKDQTTGLIWEVKTNSGVQDNRHRFTWYDSDSTTNGGYAGDYGNTSICGGALSNCNTEVYVETINNQALCGYSDWRLPTREELRSIVDYGVTDGNALIDNNYFPNTAAADHWTSQTALYPSEDATSAWEVHFDKGYSEAHAKDAESVTIRLVRSPN